MPSAMHPHNAGESRLKARRLGLKTQSQVIVFMREDCPICRSEGFAANARVFLESEKRWIIATLYHVTSDLLGPGEIGLSETAWEKLEPREGEAILVSHPRPLESMSSVRGKVYGRMLGDKAFARILADVVAGRYSDIELASFITACSARPLALGEMVSLTKAMVGVGARLHWEQKPVVDKHSVGGLPGNRTTPIVVAIVAAAGLAIPKTSSRAITSPAGTADTMETLAPVDLDLATIRRVVERENGCIAWGGAVRLSPADDILIRVERALDLDSEGQLVASVLSKKIAAGSHVVVLDMPVGPTAKVRSKDAAELLSHNLVSVAAEFGLKARVILSDGLQPVGHGIGPALEARDVLCVLRNETDAAELKRRAITLAGALLELGGKAAEGAGESLARRLLESGKAWEKFQRICEAQGGMRTPPLASHRRPLYAETDGEVLTIDNRCLARIAKLAGAPDSKAAGVEIHVRLGDRVTRGAPLYTIHAATPGELAYALDYAMHKEDTVVTIGAR